jgi:hypothetical protein
VIPKLLRHGRAIINAAPSKRRGYAAVPWLRAAVVEVLAVRPSRIETDTRLANLMLTECAGMESSSLNWITHVLEEIRADILALEEETEGLLGEIIGSSRS